MDTKDNDVIDTDLIEDIDDEEMLDLVKAAKEEAQARSAYEKKHGKSKRPFPQPDDIFGRGWDTIEPVLLVVRKLKFIN